VEGVNCLERRKRRGFSNCVNGARKTEVDLGYVVRRATSLRGIEQKNFEKGRTLDSRELEERGKIELTEKNGKSRRRKECAPLFYLRRNQGPC